MTLVLPEERGGGGGGGDKVRAKQSLLDSCSSTFELIRVKFDIVLKQFKLNILILFLSKI